MLYQLPDRQVADLINKYLNNKNHLCLCVKRACACVHVCVYICRGIPTHAYIKARASHCGIFFHHSPLHYFCNTQRQGLHCLQSFPFCLDWLTGKSQDPLAPPLGLEFRATIFGFYMGAAGLNLASYSFPASISSSDTIFVCNRRIHMWKI